ncbi:integrase core domain-containing protein [Flavivirga aquatica]|uniref:integrase core domain-containing protein n=1 Tax=Flavivirga aquatica TaxID=1849968 RepID=UPI0009F5349E|nr:integrase core domain-containing protein [Flavivirga aquatica]
MTEQYDPYQNAIAERINGILKHEFLMNTDKVDINMMRKIVAQSIKIYNTKRPHLSCNLLTPEQMHKQNEIRPRSYKRKNTEELQLCSF